MVTSFPELVFSGSENQLGRLIQLLLQQKIVTVIRENVNKGEKVYFMGAEEMGYSIFILTLIPLKAI